MAFEVSLRDQIEAAIKPWKTSRIKPPYSVDELIVMALVLRDKPTTVHRLIKWFGKTSRYYDDLVYVYFSRGLEPGRTQSMQVSKATSFMRTLREAFHKYQLPVTRHESDLVEEESYSVKTQEARLYLAKHFGSQRGNTFPFLQLPAELRTCIYELVASYPKSGLFVQLENPSRLIIRTATREFNKPISLSFGGRYGASLTVASLQDMLSLAQTNKQIYREFLPVFLSINTFCFNSVYNLRDASKGITESHSRHLSHIAFTYEPWERKLATETFKWLASLPNLRKLDIRIDGES